MIEKLQTKRSEAAKSLRDMLDIAKTEERALNVDERSKYDNVVEEINNIDETVKRLKAQEAREKELDTVEVRQFAEQATEPKKDTAQEEFRAFMSGRLDQFEKRGDMTTVTGATGGYMIPEKFSNTLREYLATDNVIRQLATVENWQGDGAFPVVTAFGTSYLVAEGSAVTDTNPTLAQKKVTGYQLMYKVDVPRKLIETSQYPLEEKLMGWWAKSRAVKEESLFATGSGSSQPTGLNATEGNGGASDGTEAASNSALVGDDIMKWLYDVKPGYRRRGSWIFNDAIIKIIRMIKNPVTTSGALHYLWMPGLSASEPDTLLGRPIYPSAGFPNELAASAKLGVFGDISQYIIVDFARPQMMRDPYSRNTYGEVRFVGWQLIDTALPVQEAISKCLLPA